LIAQCTLAAPSSPLARPLASDIVGAIVGSIAFAKLDRFMGLLAAKGRLLRFHDRTPQGLRQLAECWVRLLFLLTRPELVVKPILTRATADLFEILSRLLLPHF